MANTSPRLRRRTFVQFVGLAAGGIGPLLSACSQAVPELPRRPRRLRRAQRTHRSGPSFRPIRRRPTDLPQIFQQWAALRGRLQLYPPICAQRDTDVPGQAGWSPPSSSRCSRRPRRSTNPAWQEVNGSSAHSSTSTWSPSPIPGQARHADGRQRPAGPDQRLPRHQRHRQLAAVPAAQCADLTPYLAGDSARTTRTSPPSPPSHGGIQAR